jgi:hypothetical protein
MSIETSNEENWKGLEALAEKSYDEMYDASSESECIGLYSDIKECFYDAIKLAGEAGREDEVERMKKRLDHIKAVYRSQFS